MSKKKSKISHKIDNSLGKHKIFQWAKKDQVGTLNRLINSHEENLNRNTVFNLQEATGQKSS